MLGFRFSSLYLSGVGDCITGSQPEHQQAEKFGGVGSSNTEIAGTPGDFLYLTIYIFNGIICQNQVLEKRMKTFRLSLIEHQVLDNLVTQMGVSEGYTCTKVDVLRSLLHLGLEVCKENLECIKSVQTLNTDGKAPSTFRLSHADDELLHQLRTILDVPTDTHVIRVLIAYSLHSSAPPTLKVVPLSAEVPTKANVKTITMRVMIPAVLYKRLRAHAHNEDIASVEIFCAKWLEALATGLEEET